MANSIKRCRAYVGVSCVDGTCPKACAEEYEEYGMSVPKNCSDCFMYNGCEDCALAGTEHCSKEIEPNEKG